MGALRIVFRVDGGEGIGLGHLMRCYGLARHLNDNGSACKLITATADVPLLKWWVDCGIPVDTIEPGLSGQEDAGITSRKALDFGCDWLVVDGYHLKLSFQQSIRRKKVSLLLFDDIAANPIAADIVINQNPAAEDRFQYDAGHSLLGAGYTVIRPELLALRDQAKPKESRLLITLGGYDDQGWGHEVLSAFLEINTEIPVLLVGGTPQDRYRDGAHGSNPDVTFVPQGNIASQMATSSLAVCAGGTTCLELMFLGTPAVVLVLAKNQEPGMVALEKHGCIRIARSVREAASMAEKLIKDEAVLGRMAQSGRQLIDGKGASRIAAAMAAHVG